MVVGPVGFVGFVAGLDGWGSLRVGARDCLGKAELVASFLVVSVVMTRPFGEGPAEEGLALAQGPAAGEEPALASRPAAGGRLVPAEGPAAAGLAAASVEQSAVHYKAHPHEAPLMHHSPMAPAVYTATPAYHPSTKTEYH